MKAEPIEVAGIDLGGSWDEHVERTRGAIAKIDHLAAKSQAQAPSIVITNEIRK